MKKEEPQPHPNEYFSNFWGRFGERRFIGNSIEDFDKWHSDFLHWLKILISRYEKESNDFKPADLKITGENEWQGCRRIDFQFINPIYGHLIPGTVLEPMGEKQREKKNRRAVLCQHGHGLGGKRSLIGDRSDPAVSDEIDRYKYDYALKLCQAGFITLSIDLMRWGERSLPDGLPDIDPCNIAGLNLAAMGRNFMVMNVSDIRHAITIMQDWDDVDPAKTGMCGLSAGGHFTCVVSALDSRIQAVVAAGACNLLQYFARRFKMISSCSILPGLLPDADTQDLYAAICPRALMIQNGRNDSGSISTAPGIIVPHIEKCFKINNVPEKFCYHEFDGSHEFDSETAANWLNKWL